MDKKYKATQLDYHGYGIVNEQDKTFFVKNLLPGEEATIDITAQKGNICFATAKKHYLLSPERSTYPYSDIANLIILKPNAQISFQAFITRQTITKFKLLPQEIMPPLVNDNYFNYRNKGTFMVANKPYLTLGSYYANSHTFYVPDNPLLAQVIKGLQTKFNNLFSHDKITCHGLKKVVIQANEKDTILVTFIGHDLQQLIAYIKTLHLGDVNIVGIIFHNDKIKRNFCLQGVNLLPFSINGLIYYTNAQSFLQVNTSMIGHMYEEIKSHVAPSDIVMDAFAGSATIGQYIAKKVKEVIAIELSPTAIQLAKASIKLNKINNIKLLTGDFFTISDGYFTKVNTIIFDPPRKGLSQKTITKINSLPNIKKIIYLSCNLTTLARDLVWFKEKYQLLKVIPIRNFWHTVENETLVILKRITAQ